MHGLQTIADFITEGWDVSPCSLINHKKEATNSKNWMKSCWICFRADSFHRCRYFVSIENWILSFYTAPFLLSLMVVITFCSVCQRYLKIFPKLSLASNETGPARVSVPTCTWICGWRCEAWWCLSFSLTVLLQSNKQRRKQMTVWWTCIWMCIYVGIPMYIHVFF